MKERILKQAKREYSPRKRIIALMIGGIFFLGILPVALVYLSSLLDSRFGLPQLDYGAISVAIGWFFMV